MPVLYQPPMTSTICLQHISRIFLEFLSLLPGVSGSSSSLSDGGRLIEAHVRVETSLLLVTLLGEELECPHVAYGHDARRTYNFKTVHNRLGVQRASRPRDAGRADSSEAALLSGDVMMLRCAGRGSGWLVQIRSESPARAIRRDTSRVLIWALSQNVGVWGWMRHLCDGRGQVAVKQSAQRWDEVLV